MGALSATVPASGAATSGSPQTPRPSHWPDHIVISEIGATGVDAFVELYNPMNETVEVDGYSLQLLDVNGSLQSPHPLEETELAPFGYFLIVAADAEPALRTQADLVAPFQLSQHGTVVLVKDTAPVAGADDDDIVDMVGFGANAAWAEGGAPAPAVALNGSIERLPGYTNRGGGNGYDTDNNTADFIVRDAMLGPEPHNSTVTETPEVASREKIAPFAFAPLLAIGWMSVMILIGVALRAKIRFFQRFLIPSCLIGGLIGMILVNIGLLPIDPEMLETIAYHFFNISFISLGLSFTPKKDEKKRKKRTKEMVKGPLWMGLIEGVALPLQAVLGGLCILLFNFFGADLFPTFGFLAPLGFTEGPGQALSIGKVWEGFDFAFAATIGLTFAAIGFMFAFFIGVPLANWGIRKGYAAEAPKELPTSFLCGLVPRDECKEPAGHLTTHSGNIETLAFQLALIGFVYIITYGLVYAIGALLSFEIASMLWGFFFFLGLIVAFVVKLIIVKADGDYLIDTGIQQRVTGWAVDFLITATVMAIQLVIVAQFILPITVVSAITGIATTFVVIYLGKRIWSYNHERTVAMFGTVTGTVSTGLLLLRIVDPEFKTSVAIELGVMLIFAAPIVLSSMLLVSAPILWGWTLLQTLLVFLAMSLTSLVLIRVLGLWGPPKY